MKDRFNFDDDHCVGRLFDSLRANRFEWDFDTILKDLPSPFPIVCFLYEYTRSMPDLKQSVLEALRQGKRAHEFALKHLRPELREHITKLIADFPEWPACPFIFTNPQHSCNYAYKGWHILEEDAPLIPFLVDLRISNKDNQLLFELWLKDQGLKEQKSRRGSGDPCRQARTYLRWLSHSRLWTMIKEGTRDGKGNDNDRFQLYSEFMGRSLCKYKSSQKLNDAHKKAGLIIQNLLRKPPPNHLN